MDADVWVAVVNLPIAVAVGWGAWRIGRSQLDVAQRAESLNNYRWAVEQVGHTDAAQREAGWVMLQTLATDPSLTAADKRMMDATVRKLRAARGPTP